MKALITSLLLSCTFSISAQVFSQDLANKLGLQSDTFFYKNNLGHDCIKVTIQDVGNDLLLTGLMQVQYWRNLLEDSTFLEKVERLKTKGFQLQLSNPFLLDSILWLKNDSLVRKKDYTKNDTQIELLWQRGYFSNGNEIIDLGEDNFDIKAIQKTAFKSTIQDFYELKPMYQTFEATFDYLNSSDSSLIVDIIIDDGEKEFSTQQTISPWDTLQLSILDTLNTQSYNAKIEVIDTYSKITYYQGTFRADGYHIHMKDFYKQEAKAKDNPTYVISKNEPLRIATLPNHHLMYIFRKDRLVSTIPTRSIIHAVDFSDYRKGEYLLEVTDLSNNDKIYHTITLTK